MEPQTILEMGEVVENDQIEVSAVNRPFDGGQDKISDTVVVGIEWADLFTDTKQAAKRLSDNFNLPIDDCVAAQRHMMEDGSVPYEQLPESLKSRIRSDILFDLNWSEMTEEDLMI